MVFRCRGKFYEGITDEERAKIQGALEVIGICECEPLLKRLAHLKIKSIVRLIRKRMAGCGYAVGELYAVAYDLREEDINWAIRYGDEADIKRALCEAIEYSGHDCEYNYCEYINSVDWKNDEEV